MRIRILGSAAGKSSQWNRGCGNCVAVRQGTFCGSRATHLRSARTDPPGFWLSPAREILAVQQKSVELHPCALRILAGAAPTITPLRELNFSLLANHAVDPADLREENSTFGTSQLHPASSREFPQSEAEASFPSWRLTEKIRLRCQVHNLSAHIPRYVMIYVAKILTTTKPRRRCSFESAGSGWRMFRRWGALSDAAGRYLFGWICCCFDVLLERRRIANVCRSARMAHQIRYISGGTESVSFLPKLYLSGTQDVHSSQQYESDA